MKNFLPTSPNLLHFSTIGIEDIIMNYSPDIEDHPIFVDSIIPTSDFDEDIIIDEVVDSIGVDTEDEDNIIDDLLATYFK